MFKISQQRVGMVLSTLALIGIGLIFRGCDFSGNADSRSRIASVKEDFLIPDTVGTIIVAEPYETTKVEEMTPEESAKSRYKQKQDEVHIADIHVLYEDGKKIWYNPWTSETEYGYDNRLFIYDSETDSERVISLNKTSQDDDAMCVEGVEERYGVLTIIMSEYRNSNGWIEGTYVWQYNCKTGTWKALAKECAGAKFVDNGNAVRIDNVDILNPDAPTFEQQYRHNYKTIRL